MRYLNTEMMNIISAVITTIATLLILYAGWTLPFNLTRWQKKTYHTSSISMRHVRRNNFLLSLIAAYEPKVKELLDPPPDEVIVAVSNTPEKRVPRGMVIVKVGGQSREVTLPLFRTSPVRPLFEAILEMRFDVDQESELVVDEKEAHVG